MAGGFTEKLPGRARKAFCILRRRQEWKEGEPNVHPAMWGHEPGGPAWAPSSAPPHTHPAAAGQAAPKGSEPAGKPMSRAK